MKNSWSLANRLTLWFSSTAFLLVLMTTVTLYWSLARTLDSEDGLLIFDKIQTITRLLSSGPSQFSGVKDRVEKEWATRQYERIYVRVLDQVGKVVIETPGFDDISKGIFDGIPVIQLESKAGMSLSNPVIFANGINGKTGQGGRIAQRAHHVEKKTTEAGRVFKIESVRTVIDSPNAQQVLIQIALDRTREETFLATFRLRLALVLLITLLITAWVGRRIAVKGIQPISDIAEAVQKIKSTTLHDRIVLSDVPTELSILTSSFNEMLDRLKESFERLSRFSADIAHDLRTPINNLRGELEVALGKQRPLEEYKDVLGSCLEECARISQLIDSLLFLSRSENPRTELLLERINIHSEIQNILEFFDAPMSDSGLVLTVEIPEEVYINADRTLFQRALGNLIGNAIQYSAPGGTISVLAKVTSSTIRIEVTDCGIGISPENIPKVFDRFFRVDAARSAKSGNSGLGLAIVKSIMTLHHGEVEITSELGKGTTVALLFPS